jgi:hypothetical protein
LQQKGPSRYFFFGGGQLFAISWPLFAFNPEKRLCLSGLGGFGAYALKPGRF